MQKQISTGGLLAVLALAGYGGDSDQAKKELAKAQAQARQELASARGDVKKERGAAQSQLAEVKKQITDERQTLADEKQKVATERDRLDRLKNQVSQARANVARDTIPGSGTFLIGADVAPGTYRAAAQSGCYWARLSTLNTADIIDNNNADGPVVVEIKASDKAFEAQGCADFHKIG
jgi:multidrug efflux pump subunit AcrA (membrane-fusion protein)